MKLGCETFTNGVEYDTVRRSPAALGKRARLSILGSKGAAGWPAGFGFDDHGMDAFLTLILLGLRGGERVEGGTKDEAEDEVEGMGGTVRGDSKNPGT